MIPSPLAARQAMDQVREWLSRPAAWTPGATDRHQDLLARFAGRPGIRAGLVHDAQLAAIAVGHGLVLMTNDTGFARFPDLRWENPLAA